MTPKEAATLIGCDVAHVRWLIRKKKLKAKKRTSTNNQHGYEWVVNRKDAERVRDEKQTTGRPRGVRQ